MAALEKVYPCLTCGQDIKLERKDNRWLRWNLDGTVHIDPKKKTTTSTTTTTTKQEAPPQQQQHQQQKFLQDENRLLNLEKDLSSLKGYVRSLVTQVQLLRQEVDKIRKCLIK
jgi:chromosome segregation ATPase